MPKYESILEQRDKKIASTLEKFTVGFDKIENKLYKQLDNSLKRLTVNFGKLKEDAYSRKVILQLNDTIREALQDSGYGNRVQDLVTNFDFIAEDNIKLQKELNKKVVSESIINGVKQIEIQNTIDNLLSSGISNDFILPVRQALYRHVVLGTSVLDAEKTIKDIILSKDGKDSNLLRYVKTAAQDAIFQFDGAVNQKIKEELGLDGFLYTGSIIESSRGQCRFWVAKRVLKSNQVLQNQINTAIAGGKLGGYKCSGMIDGTSLDNFSVNRGGRKCRHRAIGVIYANFA